MARIFITGSADGLGRAAAETLIQSGHDVVVHARSKERLAQLGTFVNRTGGAVVGDLSLPDDVRSIAEQVNAIGQMDAVIHNAGIYRTDRRAPAPDAHATILMVNALAPYMLTALIHRPDRLVYLSSSEHHAGEGPLLDLDWRTRAWDPARAYGESKLYVVALAFALARRWPDVLSNAVDPGWARTRMGGRGAPISIEAGQGTQSWLAVGQEPEAMVSGRYWHQLRQHQPARQAAEIDYQERLMELMAQLSGVALG